MKQHRRSVPGLSGDKIRTFCRKNRQLDCSSGGLWTQFPEPKLFDAATGSNSRGLFAAASHGSGDLQSRAGDRRRAVADVKANTPNLRITLRSLSILDPYLRTIERSISIIILGL